MEEKKPHPLSKEGRALREAKVEAEIVETKQPDLSKIFEELQKTNERMAKLEAENKKLKDGVNIHKEEKKQYDGPLSFKFKIWLGKPVCSVKSKYKDPTKDLVYSDGKGHFINNHFFDITLSDGTVVEHDALEFGKNVKYSDQHFAKDHNGEDIFKDTLKRVKHYVFNTEEFGTFTVLSNSIN